MQQNVLWTKSQARLKQFRQQGNSHYNWLFLPGGPGLGSESLTQLMEVLSLPGTMWYLDLPGDGSNNTEDDEQHFARWSDGLIEATAALDHVILVAHSSGGMFALATPEIENNLVGLVLMGSAPDAGWQNFFMQYVEKHPIAEATRLQKMYEANPSNGILRDLTIACAPYFSTAKSLKQIAAMLTILPFNYKSHQWAEKNFDATYQAKWIPQKIPTLIFTGEHDHITPFMLFSQSQQFHRANIDMHEIKNASHFPWFDNPEQVKEVFRKYYQLLEQV